MGVVVKGSVVHVGMRSVINGLRYSLLQQAHLPREFRFRPDEQQACTWRWVLFLLCLSLNLIHTQVEHKPSPAARTGHAQSLGQDLRRVTGNPTPPRQREEGFSS
jgi:hypothetical protein